MKVATGTVVGGKIVVEGATLTDGSTVTVLLGGDPQELTPEEEERLLRAVGEIEGRGASTGERLLARLRRFR